MVPVDERMRIGSRTRDRLGMLCATGAVACLAIFNVQWARELPVQPNYWEQDLFGDLSTPAVSLSQEIPAEPATPSPRPVFESGSEKPMLVAVAPEPKASSHAAQIESQPFELQPRAPQAEFIQPVLHQHPPPDAAPTVWLSGGIELLSDDPAPSSQPGVQYFPQDTATRPGSE